MGNFTLHFQCVMREIRKFVCILVGAWSILSSGANSRKRKCWCCENPSRFVKIRFMSP